MPLCKLINFEPSVSNLESCNEIYYCLTSQHQHDYEYFGDLSLDDTCTLFFLQEQFQKFEPSHNFPGILPSFLAVEVLNPSDTMSVLNNEPTRLRVFDVIYSKNDLSDIGCSLILNTFIVVKKVTAPLPQCPAPVLINFASSLCDFLCAHLIILLNS